MHREWPAAGMGDGGEDPRILGDNGKADDNILMHILSPCPAHRNALTDCEKLASSSLGQQKATLIYAYDAGEWPLEPAISAFETFARERDWHSAGDARVGSMA